ncbi:MAG: hypothetical protein F9K19_04195 [Rhizobiaceae bacterium]|nr:MAG: hypothetical protein F9K19_04195 [Rhizobiaceae bacterium]CAG0987323.1 hypothetical protein RHIZO_02059 [Rhizobiaceae bacterium]
MQIEECILMIRRSACCDKRPVSGEDFALRFDHLGELCRQPVVHSAREIAVAAETIGKDVNPQTRKLRDKHEIVVCHVMNSFILMTEAGDGQVEHRVKDREATAGGGAWGSRFSGGALLQGDG